MYVQRNIEARSCNQCRREIANNITYSECVLVALFMQHVTRTRHINLRGLSGSTIFFHVVS